VAVRINHHSPQFLVGLLPGPGRPEFYDVTGRLLQVGNAEVKVVLLGMLLPWPLRAPAQTAL
jgi:hypothetical protein